MSFLKSCVETLFFCYCPPPPSPLFFSDRSMFSRCAARPSAQNRSRHVFLTYREPSGTSNLAYLLLFVLFAGALFECFPSPSRAFRSYLSLETRKTSFGPPLE